MKKRNIASWIGGWKDMTDDDMAVETVKKALNKFISEGFGLDDRDQIPECFF